MSRQRTLEQERAKAAWARVEAAKGPHESKYRQLTRSAQADIQAHGLGQTLSFWNAKGKKEAHYRTIMADVSAWTEGQLGLTGKPLLNWIVNEAKTSDYRRATVEAQAFLGWLKRLAEAELKDK